jgi:hypothetical protein
VLTNRAAIAATIAISTRLNTFMFSLAVGDIRQEQSLSGVAHAASSSLIVQAAILAGVR